MTEQKETDLRHYFLFPLVQGTQTETQPIQQFARSMWADAALPCRQLEHGRLWVGGLDYDAWRRQLRGSQVVMHRFKLRGSSAEHLQELACRRGRDKRHRLLIGYVTHTEWATCVKCINFDILSPILITYEHRCIYDLKPPPPHRIRGCAGEWPVVPVNKSLLSTALSPQGSRAENLMRILEGCVLSTHR